jgi:hypothetical protein
MPDTVKLNLKKKIGIDELPANFEKAAYNAVGQILEYARQRAIQYAPEISGRLKGAKGGEPPITWNIKVELHIIEGRLCAVARNPETGEDYAWFVHEGTGLYGPRKSLIYPKKAKVLAFMKDPRMARPTTAQEWKIARINGLVWIAKHTKGQRPNPFLSKALYDASKKAKEIFRDEIEKLNQEAR